MMMMMETAGHGSTVLALLSLFKNQLRFVAENAYMCLLYLYLFLTINLKKKIFICFFLLIHRRLVKNYQPKKKEEEEYE